jgi:hypothetical protein
MIAFETLHFSVFPEEENPIVDMASIYDSDTLYLWEAPKQTDFPMFQKVMQKVINDHTK